MNAFIVRDGEVFHRGTHRDPDICQALLTTLREQARAGDWWSKHAAQLAEELALAMREARAQQQDMH